MAMGGVHSVDVAFDLNSSNVQVIISKSDMFKTDASAIVVGEDAALSGVGRVARHLSTISSKDFQKAQEKLKADNGRLFRVGKVYACSVSPRSKISDSVNFSGVYYAIVPPRSRSVSTDWDKTIRHMYYEAMTQADKDGRRSLALPVLGSGKSTLFLFWNILLLRFLPRSLLWNIQ
jgi:hypothetical protein